MLPDTMGMKILLAVVFAVLAFAFAAHLLVQPFVARIDALAAHVGR